MSKNDIKVVCPYCNEEFYTVKPDKVEGKPSEIECVPYTRDIGRFDPDNEEVWFNEPNEWSRIGKDFFSWLNWERFGILRIVEKGINIQYRVQGCKKCKSLFDVYANYTPSRKKIKDIWPHLFKPTATNGKGITPYHGESWIIWFIRRIGSFVRSKSLAAFLIGVSFFCLGFIPALFSTPTNSYIAQRIPSGILGGLFSNLTTHENFIINKGILYGTVSIGVICLLIIAERYVDYLENTNEFDDLFKVENKSRGIVHWRNYILCRFVGVQEPNHHPRVTQVDIVAGGLSMALVLIIWVITQHSWLLLLYLVGGLVSLGLVGFLTNLILITVKLPTWGKYLRIILPLLIMVGLIIWRFLSWGALPANEWWNIGLTVSDLLFWFFATYIIGISVWLGMSTSHYVLKGLTRIPMNLSPYDNFSLVRALRSIETFSISVLLVVFIMVLLIVSYMQFLVPYDWLLIWFRIVLAVLLAGIGLGIDRGVYVGLAFIYIIFSFLFDGIKSSIFSFPINGPLLTLGVFYTILIGFQIYYSDNIVNGLLENAKNEEIKNLNNQVATLQEQYEEIDRKISSGLNKLKNEELAALQNQRQAILGSIDVLLKILERVGKSQVGPKIIQRVTEISTPFFTSVILPYAWEKLIDLY